MDNDSQAMSERARRIALQGRDHLRLLLRRHHEFEAAGEDPPDWTGPNPLPARDLMTA